MQKLRFYSIFFFLLVSLHTWAQESLSYKFRVYLKDKGENVYSTDKPEAFLTSASIERKKRQNVTIDESDFPISPNYFTLVQKAGGKIISHSKWFNTLIVEVADSSKINDITQLPFVNSAKYVWRGTPQKSTTSQRPRLRQTPYNNTPEVESFLGATQPQFTLHNAEEMAKAGFQGKGIRVGVIDAGFTNADVIPLFERINFRGFNDFVPTGDIFASSDHGTRVVSTMAVNQPNLMMGSAPEAMYWLMRSEDAASEFPIEEDYWVRAVEYADSIGIDIINTSLGYNKFDDAWLNYSHADLTGKKSIMSLAADKAYDKGILLVASAGNEGNKQWQKLTPPGDAIHTVTVGAVGVDSVIAAFSSRGPTADGRIKPDLVSVGRGTITIGRNGLIGMANGTSFSSPFLTGLITSLWSVNPDLHRSQIVDIVKKSADRYHTPDTIYGYGAPDFGKAVAEVLKTLPPTSQTISEKSWRIEPSKSKKEYNISLIEPQFSNESYSISLLNENGEFLNRYRFDAENSLQIPISPEIKRANKFVHFVINEPFYQKTFRVKL